MRQRVALIAVLAALAAASAAAAGGGASASAGAVGVRVTVPGAEDVTAGLVEAPPEATADVPSFALGDAVATGEVAASAGASAGTRGDAVATATVSGVSLFGGEITVGLAAVTASAGASAARAGGSVALSSLSDVTVLGQAVEPAANARVVLGDWGYAVLLEERVLPALSGTPSFAGSVAALHVYLTADHGGLPAGSEIVVGFASATASAAPVEDPGAVAVAPPASAPPSPTIEPATKPAGPSAVPPPIALKPPPEIGWWLASAPYVFPVFGPASVGYDFAVPKPDVGWHHGNDIFAPAGAPVLAVADGELFAVGWNELGGQRIWLRDEKGYEFYYAHLSAYSPLAFEGAHVQAGDVIGFVGTTGDAAGTSPHLHFEIHPPQLRSLGYDGVVSPYDYLVRWRRLDSTAFGDFQWRLEPGVAPAAAAVLLRATDISTVVALEPEDLKRVLAPLTLLDASSFRRHWEATSR